MACKTIERQLQAQDVLEQLAEEGVSEEEAVERALRVQHAHKVVGNAA